jgi:hypothetical protein
MEPDPERADHDSTASTDVERELGDLGGPGFTRLLADIDSIDDIFEEAAYEVAIRLPAARTGFSDVAELAGWLMSVVSDALADRNDPARPIVRFTVDEQTFELD